MDGCHCRWDAGAVSEEHDQPGTGSTLLATARRMGISVSAVRSYLERVRAKWAAADEPVEDLRVLIQEYPPAGSRGAPR
jgi:hypothetical protein